MSPPPLQSSLPAGWLGLYREGVEHSGSLQKVSDQSLILLFWICPGAREVSSRVRAAGQPHREHRAFALLAGHGHVAAHHARKLAREGKAEPRAAVAARGQGIGLGGL